MYLGLLKWSLLAVTLIALVSAKGNVNICPLLPVSSIQADACSTIETTLEMYYGIVGEKGRDILPTKCLETSDHLAKKVCKSYLFLVNIYFNLSGENNTISVGNNDFTDGVEPLQITGLPVPQPNFNPYNNFRGQTSPN